MKKTSILWRVLALVLALVMAFALASCGSSGTSGSTSAPAAAGSNDGQVVNIGCTSSISSLNPALMDSTWATMYAVSMEFMPLVALNQHAEFEYRLADEITTEDNLHYTVHINEDATWSDGKPVTAQDLLFTMTKLASPIIANPNMMLSALAGTDDETGYLTESSDTIEGVQVVDEKTVEFTFKYALNMISFMNGYAQYIFVMPQHVLGEVSDEEFSSYDWFNAPTVVDGPYMATGYDANHFVTYTANTSYWQGAPSIPNANIRIVDGANLYAGLQSGEIDIVPPLLGTIDLEDYEGVQALENVTATYGDAYSVENVFINTEVVDNQNIRQALLMALDRQTIVDNLFAGEADIADGFAVPAGPYWSDLTPTAYDAEGAKALVDAAIAEGWDPSTEYTIFINGGETVLANVIALAQQNWAAVGINVEIQTVDLDTLMTKAGTEEAAMIAVQYTYPPVDPSWDIQWVLGDWCHALSDEVNDSLSVLWSTNDSDEYAAALLAIDTYVQENVPMIDLYVSGSLGAVSNRLQNATASMYGSLMNVHEWTIAD